MRRLAIVACIAATLGVLGAAPAPPPASSAPAAAPAAPPKGTMGYYFVIGQAIVSKPFANDLACQKALAALKRRMEPGSDAVFCAHRHP
jgi:hypothetical protein